MNERPTPETDALILSKAGFGPTDCEWRQYSRCLERERDEAREAIHIAESLIKPQIEREQVTPEAKPDNDKQRDMTALLRLLREVRRERDEARNELEDYKASTIHSCNEECKRPMCVLRRQRREAREDAEHWKTEYLIVAARLCGKKHPRDNGIISEHEIIPKLTQERDEAREKLAEAKREAENLARSIYRTEYSDNDTGWGLLESVAGVISQIDNMYAGVREQRDEARRGIHLMAQNAELWKERADEAREAAAKWEAVALREASINGAQICGKEAAK